MVAPLASFNYDDDDDDDRNEKVKRAQGFITKKDFRRFLCWHLTANLVNHDTNGNTLIALISKIVVSSIANVTTCISTEIAIQSKTCVSLLHFCFELTHL